MATCTRLAHDIFFVVEQRIIKTADVLTFEFYIERVHHEFAYAFGSAADDAFVCTGFIPRAGAVLRPFDHGHLAVDRYRLGAFDGIGVLAQVRVGNGYHGRPALRFAYVGKHRARPTAAFVRYASAINKCCLRHGLNLINKLSV